MKKVLLALLALALLPPAARAAARQRVAVLDIRSVQGVSAGTATILTAIVVDKASRAGFDVISQSDVSAMIGFEKQKEMLGCKEDSSCLAEIGGALGVDYVLSGQVGQIGSRLHLSFQLLDSRKAKVVGRAARFSGRDEDALASAAESAVGEVLATAQARRPAQAGTEGGAAAAKNGAKAQAASPSESGESSRADLAVKAPAPAGPLEPARDSGFRPSRRMAYWTLGGGAALLAGGVVFGLQARSRRAELERAWAQPDYASIYDSKAPAVKRAATIANVCLVAGTLTTGAGGWFFFKSRGGIALAPSAGDGTVAFVAAGAF